MSGTRQSSAPATLAVAGASALGAGCAALLLLAHLRRKRNGLGGLCPKRVVPLIEFQDGTAKAKHIERFGEYVVRQLGLAPELASAALLAQAADDYVMGDKSRADKSRENLLLLAVSACTRTPLHDHDRKATELTSKLINELDACMMAYFGFHWEHSGLLLEQVLAKRSSKPKLRDVAESVMRDQKMKKAMLELKPKQRISLLIEEMKVLGKSNGGNLAAQFSSPSLSASSSLSSSPSMASSTGASSGRSLTPAASMDNLLVPLEAEQRSPVLLLIGGGMGAGKSTVVREIMKQCFWSKVALNAVVVEADAFKEKDVIFNALSADKLSDMARVAQLVHEESTRAASSTLVTALNEGRDVIFDGTMSWAPFVRQTVAMARDVHRRRYRLGPGYQKLEDGTVLEQYWEPVEGRRGGEGAAEAEDLSYGSHWARLHGHRRPYRIELVGVVCDVHLAVVRGMRRAILTRRGVPVDGQLRSHVLFAKAVEEYCKLVDHASIYSTNEVGMKPRLIGLKEERSNLLIDPGLFGVLDHIKRVNLKATNVMQLYRWPQPSWLPFLPGGEKLGPDLTWNTMVMAPGRSERQEELKRAFEEIQVCLWPRSRNGLPTSSTSFATRSSH